MYGAARAAFAGKFREHRYAPGTRPTGNMILGQHKSRNSVCRNQATLDQVVAYRPSAIRGTVLVRGLGGPAEGPPWMMC